MDNNASTGIALFSLRITLFVLMIIWAALKVAVPASYAGGGESAGIFQNFYGFTVTPDIVLYLGIAQIVFLLAFLLGLFKLITTGGVMLMNLASMVVSWDKILTPAPGSPDILFAAAVPVFGASLALFLMRKHDTFLSLGKG